MSTFVFFPAVLKAKKKQQSSSFTVRAQTMGYPVIKFNLHTQMVLGIATKF